MGYKALGNTTTGFSNSAVGAQALLNNTTGNSNVALGTSAGLGQNTGNGNVYIGSGVVGVPGENNVCYIRSIFGQTSASGAQVLVDSNNKLGTMTSSKRFKEAIKPMERDSDALFLLKPVSFRYKKEIDPKGTSQLGLVAEDVEKVNPSLVVRDQEGKPYTVRYDQVNAMLLNEFLKEHCTVKEMKSSLAKQETSMTQQRKDFEAAITQQQKQIEALTAGLQKVSAQLEVRNQTQQTVLNNQ